MNKKEYIKLLNLSPHQEGGWYRQIYTSDDQIIDPASKDKRYQYTSIYFLLDDISCSHFHRLTHDELWYYHDGDAITIHCIEENGKYYAQKLGRNIENGEVFQFKVPKGTIFASEVNVKDSFCLVSCVVSPGFDYHDFELLKREELLKAYPNYAEIIKRLSVE